MLRLDHGANGILSCRVAGGDDSICTTIRATCASRPVSIDVVLSVPLTGSAQRGGLDGDDGVLSAGNAEERRLERTVQ